MVWQQMTAVLANTFGSSRLTSGECISIAIVPMHEAQNTPGLIRSRSVAPPPTPDGRIRIVEIDGLDRQACGGTHLASTGGSPPIRTLKVDNKGRHNRRIRIGLTDTP